MTWTETTSPTRLAAAAPASVFLCTEDGLGTLQATHFPLAKTFDEVMEALAETLGQLGVSHRRIALTCFERHPGDCHRGILAEAWAALHDGEVEHLGPDGCRRLLPA